MAEWMYSFILLLLKCTLHGFTEQGVTGPFVIIFNPVSLPVIQVKIGSDLVWYTSLQNTTLIALKTQQTVSQNGGDFVIKDLILEDCIGKFKELKVVQITGSAPQVIVSGHLCNDDVFSMIFQAVSTNEGYTHLFFNLTVYSNYYNQLKLMYGCKEDEQFYGLGVQYTYFNMRGHSVPLFISEQGVGRGLEPVTIILDRFSAGAGGTHYTTYSRVPFYITSYNHSLLLESNDYAVFHIPLNGTSVIVQINATSLYGRIITGQSPLDILKSYTSYTGRMKPLPEWIHSGAILGLQGGTEIVSEWLRRVNETMGSLNDIVAVWLQDWTGQRNVTGDKDLPRTGLWWNWEVDRSHYPGWENFINLLYSNGIRVMTYINPLIINVANRGTFYQHNYYEEGIANDYFIKANGKVWKGYSNSSIVDLTNPKAYDWIKDMIIKNMLATNVSGWMCDFGESVPLDAMLYNAENPSHYHTLYSAIWSKLNAQAVQEAAEKDIITQQQASEIVYFMRSGSTFSQSVTPLFWLGDQLVTWDEYDGLASAVIGLLSSGLSGFTLTHSDIGGYTALKFPGIHLKWYIRSKELFWRWCEFSAFTTVYRTHQGTLPDDNWQFYSDTDTMKHFFRMSRVYNSWKFYRNALLKEAAEYGWPIARHMILVFPGNDAVHFENLKYQYMIGSELLVAPVVTKGETKVSVFLPRNINWIHVWSNTTYPGNNQWAEISTPLGFPAVLYPEGSTIGEQFVENLIKKGLMSFPYH